MLEAAPVAAQGEDKEFDFSVTRPWVESALPSAGRMEAGAVGVLRVRGGDHPAASSAGARRQLKWLLGLPWGSSKHLFGSVSNESSSHALKVFETEALNSHKLLLCTRASFERV